jgi:hypothetical protein
MPVGAVFGFAADRSLDAIAKQMAELDRKAADIRLTPDFAVVLDEGIVGPRSPVRKRVNQLNVPPISELRLVRTAKRHTWSRFYLHLLAELNTITLPPLDLAAYLNSPEQIGDHRISGHNNDMDLDELQGV